MMPMLKHQGLLAEFSVIVESPDSVEVVLTQACFTGVSCIFVYFSILYSRSGITANPCIIVLYSRSHIQK